MRIKIIPVIIMIVIFMPVVGASENKTRTVALENGVELTIKDIGFSRILPHAYHDQALSSIPGVYPDSEIIAKRRRGYLGKKPPAVYSLVCYKKSKKRSEITISGVVTSKTKAWSFEAGVDETAFNETLILVMEIIAQMPFNPSLQPAAPKPR